MAANSKTKKLAGLLAMNPNMTADGAVKAMKKRFGEEISKRFFFQARRRLRKNGAVKPVRKKRPKPQTTSETVSVLSWTKADLSQPITFAHLVEAKRFRDAVGAEQAATALTALEQLQV